jgi:hypothetical protein
MGDDQNPLSEIDEAFLRKLRQSYASSADLALQS